MGRGSRSLESESETLFDLPEIESVAHSFGPLKNKVWTKDKAQLIKEYLRLFVFITKHGTYIDGFAGPQDSSNLNAWSAKLVLESEPKWFRTFVLCENDPKQIDHLKKLVAEQPSEPKRMIKLLEGDFNQIVEQALAAAEIGENTAAFCLLDQRTFECDWRTVESIARHKDGRKIEIFYFLPAHWLDRAVSGLGDKSHRMEIWWGKADWENLLGLNQFNRAKLFRDRFRHELGYKYVHPLPIFGPRSGVTRLMYFMIHATDHDEAPNLMYRAYRRATGRPTPPEQHAFDFGFPSG